MRKDIVPFNPLENFTRELEKVFGHHEVINTDNFGNDITVSKQPEQEDSHA